MKALKIEGKYAKEENGCESVFTEYSHAVRSDSYFCTVIAPSLCSLGSLQDEERGQYEGMHG